MKRICVFCGSNSGVSPVYSRAAHDLGVSLADRRLALVYGGGNIGLMQFLNAHGGSIVRGWTRRLTHTLPFRYAKAGIAGSHGEILSPVATSAPCQLQRSQ